MTDEIEKTRFQMMEEWAEKGLGIQQDLLNCQLDWQKLADRYGALPLAFRRELVYDLVRERWECAALFQHILHQKNVVFDPDMLKTPFPEQIDPALVSPELCPLTEKWYEPLKEAAYHIRQFATVDSDKIDIEYIERRIGEGKEALRMAAEMLAKLEQQNSDSPTTERQVSRDKTEAWNKFCTAVQNGAPLTMAEDDYTGRKPVGGPTESVVSMAGERRMWFKIDLPCEALTS